MNKIYDAHILTSTAATVALNVPMQEMATDSLHSLAAVFVDDVVITDTN
jgi:hypothetical protein